MPPLTLLLFLLLTLSPLATHSQPVPTTTRLSQNETLPFREEHATPCCICYALHDGPSIDNTTWEGVVKLVHVLTRVHAEFNAGRSRYAVVSFGGAEAGVGALIVGLTGGVHHVEVLSSEYERRVGVGTADIGHGLVSCQRALFSMPGGVCAGRSVVLVTDGVGVVDEAVVRDVKESGVGVVVLAVGGGVDFRLLQGVATDPAWVFRVGAPALERVRAVAEGGRWLPPVVVEAASHFCRRRVPFFDFLSRV